MRALSLEKIVVTDVPPPPDFFPFYTRTERLRHFVRGTPKGNPWLVHGLPESPTRRSFDDPVLLVHAL